MILYTHTQRRTRNQYNGGYAALISVLFFMSISLLLTFGFSALAIEEKEGTRLALRAKQSYFLAEAGVEDAAYRLQTGKQLSASETITLNGEQVITTITTLGGGEKDVRADGSVVASERSVRLLFSPGVGAGFNYGVQVGDGGLIMDNSSSVVGNVYTNGSIQGTNSATITGDAFAAGSSEIRDMNVGGNAYADSIYNSTIGGSASSTALTDDSTVGEDVYSDTITDTVIGDDAYYQTSYAGSPPGGSIFPGSTPPAQLPPLTMPIPDSQIETWKLEAEAGGTITGPCPYQPLDGSSIGPIKITCDLLIDGNDVITLTGPIWVVGDINVKNNAQFNLAASYGASSEVIIADDPTNPGTKGVIAVENNANLNGSGTAGSYILVVSMNNSAETAGSNAAIIVKNSANAPIYYAPHGKITIENNAALKEATAYQMHLKNSTQVTYETGLASISFSGGPSGGWSIDSWREVE